MQSLLACGLPGGSPLPARHHATARAGGRRAAAGEECGRMRRLKILIWHIHGSYLNTLTRLDHDWCLPVRPEGGEGYGGRGWTFDWADSVREVPAGEARTLDLDLVIYQTPRNYFQDG